MSSIQHELKIKTEITKLVKKLENYLIAHKDTVYLAAVCQTRLDMDILGIKMANKPS